MPYQFYVLPLLFSASLLCILGLLVLRQSRFRTVLLFALMLFLGSVWDLAYGFEILSVPLQDKIMWAQVRYTAIAFLPLSSLFLILYYTRHFQFIKRYGLALLVVPTITILMVWTGDSHQLFRYDFKIISSTTVPNLQSSAGTWFWVYIIYNYCLMVSSIFMLYRHFDGSTPLYRRQISLICSGFALTGLMDTLFQANLSPVSGYNLMPAMFSIMALILAPAVIRFRLLDVIPIGRTTVLENIDEPVFVLDKAGQVVDYNPAARLELGFHWKSSLSRVPAVTLHKWPHLVRLIDEMQEGREIVQLPMEKGNKIFEVKVSPIKKCHQQILGRLVVMRDITEQKLAESNLHEAYDQLQLQLQQIESLQTRLREEAIRDPLTGIFNRRYLEETLKREIARSKRYHTSLSLAILDIDYFKNINDAYGHSAGDSTLIEISRLLKENSRGEDVLCRYAGDEFVLLLPGMTSEAAMQRLEEFSARIENLEVKHDKEKIKVTVSTGVAGVEDGNIDPSVLIDNADKALYTSKAAGRNQVSVYGLNKDL